MTAAKNSTQQDAWELLKLLEQVNREENRDWGEWMLQMSSEKELTPSILAKIYSGE